MIEMKKFTDAINEEDETIAASIIKIIEIKDLSLTLKKRF